MDVHVGGAGGEPTGAHRASVFVSLPLLGGLSGWELEVGEGAIPTICLCSF